MNFAIHNKYIKATIRDFGAELVSAVADGREFMWGGGEVWPKHAPNLFPIVGSLIDNEYIYQGKTYHLTHHGFARDMKFDMLHQSQHSIAFVLQDTEATLQSYPFKFTLIIAYKIKGNKLTQRFRVINTGETSMPVSFGGHPAFAVSNINEYELAFENDESPPVFLLEGKQIGLEQHHLIQEESLPLNEHTFDRDALIFKDLSSEYVALRHTKSSHEVRVRISEFPFLGIWAKPKSNFVCIEPWQGVADFSNHDKRIENKTGIVWVAPGEERIQTFCMQFNS